MCQVPRSGIMLPSTLSHPLERKHPGRSTPASRSNPITFRTLTFVISRESSFLICRKLMRGKWTSISFLLFEITCIFRRITKITYLRYVILKAMRTFWNYLHLLNYLWRKKLANWYIYVTSEKWRARWYTHDFLTQRVLRSYGALTIARALAPMLFYRGG